MLNITLYLMHPCNVITAGLASFFHRANNGLFSSTLIFFLVLNKTMETTKGETYTMAIEQAFIMDVCKIYTAFKYNQMRVLLFVRNGFYRNTRCIKIGQMHLPHTNFAAQNILAICGSATAGIYFHPKFPIFCKHFKQGGYEVIYNMLIYPASIEPGLHANYVYYICNYIDEICMRIIRF